MIFVDLKKHFPNRVRIIPSIGYSHEGRPIMALAISEGQNETRSQSQDPRPQFYIQGGIHAREWISHATLQYISFQLASSSDAAIVSLLEKGEFLIVPVMNPDGYVYTWNRDRLWRKNRRPNADHSHGVDLNRNFDARWGHEGTSKVPSSETYCGPFSASEPEVQAVSKFFESQNGIVMALDLHSYSQLILRPIGWTNKDSPHEKQLKKVGKKMAQIIQSVHDKLYISEKSVALYPTTGAAHDWFYMQKKTQVIHGESYTIRPYAMTIELRPTAEWFGPGFILDASEIIPTGEEILPAVLHLANYSLYHPLWTKKSFTHSSLAESILFSPYLYFLLPFLCFVIWTSRTLFASSKKCQNCTEKKPFMTESEKKNSMKEVL
ncbi:hypothetical protein HMI54_005812 [Coelomomyces lativittatus]|nr:hypothetical protein HMI56_004108 [Coelomomyces lativittatus]KAJ1517377.1 hypothetical protein HMI54_005812 [Coelomomyces lativittatus]